MDASKDHKNWITVGEVVRLIKEPVALYTSHIVDKLHVEISSRLSSGVCANPAACLTKKNPGDLCNFCKRWYEELAKSHQTKDRRQIKWRENCVTSNWPVDSWEVAKYFMPSLGDNKTTTKDAESTDLSSLLNVLAWMKDAVFAPDRRLNRNLVIKFRSKVRNPWAHAPSQKFSEDVLENAFHIANNLVADLDKVFTCDEVKQCINDIKSLQANGLTNVAESKLEILNLVRVELRENVRKLEEVVDFINKQGNDGLKSCIPDKLLIFIGRETEVEKIICSIVKNDCGIVSIVGGPGFGKSSLAVQVSHDLKNKHDIVVIFTFLLNSSTLSDVVLRLCNDVGVNPGEDPKSALMFWLKSVENKVVLVMDNIEQLLEGKVKGEFIELVRTLRKNSRQHLQILTTSRIEFSIPQQTTKNHQILELDKTSSVELLKRCCPNEKVTDAYLSELADLCGYVPIALCIVGTLIPSLDDPLELVEWLSEKPMETLQNSAHCVKKAIEVSFERLSDEDQKAFVRLSGFDGNFERMSAEEVIKRNGLKTKQFLENLVTRSLIQRSGDKRFVIHSLIRRFLADHDQFQDEKTIAQGLMVEHFLKKCYSLTMDSYSEYDGFTNAREKFRRDAHNVEETLKICSQNHATNLKPNILEILVCSDVYKSSSMFFYKLSRDFLPQIVLQNFHTSCIKVAESRNEAAIQIAFQCLVADQVGRKTAWKSSEYINIMDKIAEMFRQIKTALRSDRILLMYYYDFYNRYMSIVKNENTLPDPLDEDLPRLSERKDLSPMAKAVEIHILIERGHLNKHASKMYPTNKEISKLHKFCAESCYNRALLKAKPLFGNHELTCSLQKKFGDFYLNCRDYQEALSHYSEAIKLRKELKLDANEQFVFLVKNYGICLSFLRRHDEAVENFKEALDVAEKLAEKHTVCRALVHYQLAITYSYWQIDCREAAVYAKLALQMQDLLDPRGVKKMKIIIARAERNFSQECLDFRMFQE